MTGFGSIEGQTARHTISLQCRSVNHRNLDVRLFLPPSLQAQELSLTKVVKSFFHRGRIELRIQIEEQGAGFSDANFATAHQRLAELSKKHDLLAPTLSEILSFQRTSLETNSTDFDVSVLKEYVQKCCQQLLTQRKAEGARLVPVLQEYLQTIQKCVDIIRTCAAENPKLVYQKLHERLQAKLEKLELESLDQTRLAQELILYVDKSDISEELQRLASHIEAVDNLIASDEIGIGKKLDFYMQEFFRETNTIGSKTNLAAIINEVVVMKVTIEKIREQAANIE